MSKREIFVVLLILILCLGSCLTTSAQDTVIKPKVIKKVDTSNIRGEKAPEKPKLEYRSGYLLVKFKEEKMRQAEKEIASMGAYIEKTFRMTRISVLKVPAGKELDTAKALLRAGLVEYAEPDYIQRICAIPNDPQFPNQWGLNNPQDTDIDAPEAWDISKGSKNVVVAVIDTGVDYNHEDLAANMWHNPGEIPNNGVDDDGNGYVDDYYGIDTFNGDGDPYDDNGHGTHVSGIIGAVGNNGIGVTGVNWNVSIMAIKFIGADGWGYTSGAIEALEYVMMMKSLGVNVKVTSNSWGSYWYSKALYDTIKMAGENNILFVAAAGNWHVDADYELPLYPAAYDLPNIISVAATRSDGSLTSWTTYGRSSVDIAAPGEDILSTVPGNSYESWSGTSMATPFVSGVAALLLSTPQRANYNPVSLKFNILFTAEYQGYPILTGGRVNAYNALSTPPNENKLHILILSPTSSGGGIHRTAGQSITIEAMVGNAGGIVPGVVVTAKVGSASTTLKDDGIAPDKFAGDGVYTGSITLNEVGSFTLNVTASATGYTSASIAIPLTVWLFNNYEFQSIQYNWIDISNTGMPLNLGDDGEVIIMTDFDINFYGGKYRMIGIGSNGAIAFDDSPAWYYFNTRTGFKFGKMLLPFWDDLVTYPYSYLPSSSNVYVAELGTKPNRVLIVQYNNVPLSMYPDPAYSITFQVRFYENNSNIDIYYKDVTFFNEYYDQGPDKGGLATIGVQYSSSYGIYSEYSFNKPVLSDGSAIRLKFVPKLYFDMGTSTSPVAAGFTRVTESTTYGYSGYGWTTTQQSRDRGSPDDLRRDFVTNSQPGTFKVALPNGLYTVRIIVGDYQYAHDNIDIYVEGILKVDDLTVGAGKFKEISLPVSISDGDLAITFRDDGGTDHNWVVNGIYIVEGAYFDLGTPSSPVYSDFINASTGLYNPIAGYGWLSNYKLYSRDRGTSDYLLRDFVISPYARTFRIDIPGPGGWYVVTTLHCDPSYSHEFSVYEYYVQIRAGEVAGIWYPGYWYPVSIRISDGIGSDPYWVLDAIYVTSAPW